MVGPRCVGADFPRSDATPHRFSPNPRPPFHPRPVPPPPPTDKWDAAQRDPYHGGGVNPGGAERLSIVANFEGHHG